MIIFLILVLLVVIIIFIAYQIFIVLENIQLFVPRKSHVWTPSDYEDVYFQSEGHLIHGWFINPFPKAPIVLFCHGNTGNISDREYIIRLCHAMKFNLFIYDYRGYGKSEGRSTLWSLPFDASAAYEEVIQRGYPSDKIIVWGESLGGIAATHIAANHQVARLILVATFDSLHQLALDSHTFFGYISYLFLYLQSESNLRRVREVKIPVLVIHSSEDEIIPYSHGVKLYHHVNHPWKKMMSIKGGHGTPELEIEDIQRILRFCWNYSPLTGDLKDLLDYVAQNADKHVPS